MPADAADAARGDRILVVTNDFPPRRGGIESFVRALCDGLSPDGLVVYTARMSGSAAVDDAVPYPVVRDRLRMLVPTRRVARDVCSVAQRYGCTRVLFGASMPLGLLAGALRSTTVTCQIGLTHGHEVWWARLPGSRGLLRRVGAQTDALTYVSEYCRQRIARALDPADAAAMVRLSPGVDCDVFNPQVDGTPVRRRLGIDDDQPVVVAASRLVARKGHDVLIAGWPLVLTHHPRAVLVVVGDGPARRRLQHRVQARQLASSVRFVTDARWSDMPAVYAAGNVFAQPCRTRLHGLEPEALGIVFLEAAATGLPVIVGRSGGAPETVVDGVTGFVVDPRSVAEVADRICRLLGDPVVAAQMGERGRAWVARHYSWATAVATARRLLTGRSPTTGDRPEAQA